MKFSSILVFCFLLITMVRAYPGGIRFNISLPVQSTCVQLTDTTDRAQARNLPGLGFQAPFDMIITRIRFANSDDPTPWFPRAQPSLCLLEANATCSYEIVEWSPNDIPDSSQVEGAGSSKFTSIWRYSGQFQSGPTSTPNLPINLQVRLTSGRYYGIFSSCMTNRFYTSNPAVLSANDPVVYYASTTQISNNAVPLSNVRLNLDGASVQAFPLLVFGGINFNKATSLRYLAPISPLPLWSATPFPNPTFVSDWGEATPSFGPFDIGFSEILFVRGCNATFPCSNGGTCNAGVCTCGSNFKGPLCDEPACTPACVNDGVCVAGQCQCISGYYSGVSCEVANCTSLVYPNGCLNGGTCVRPGTLVPCDCPSGFTGPVCQVTLQSTTNLLVNTPAPTGINRPEGRFLRYWNYYPHATGFYFTAPIDMKIVSIMIPNIIGAFFQHFQILSLDRDPTYFSAGENFTTRALTNQPVKTRLFSAVAAPTDQFVNVNLTITSGTRVAIIGLLEGGWQNAGQMTVFNSANSPFRLSRYWLNSTTSLQSEARGVFNTSILGLPVQLKGIRTVYPFPITNVNLSTIYAGAFAAPFVSAALRINGNFYEALEATSGNTFMGTALMTVGPASGCFNSCFNNGTCINNVCSCLPGFDGELCENVISCTPACTHGGVCQRNVGSGTTFCNCSATDFTGNICQTPACSSCVNGTCEEISPTNPRAQCVCNSGYAGAACNQPDCSTLSDCSGNGVCILPFECQCNAGWKGARCNEPDPTTSPVTSKTNSSGSIGPIIGGVVGGVVCLILVIVIVVFLVFRKRKSQVVEVTNTTTLAPVEPNKVVPSNSEMDLRRQLGNWEIDFRELVFQNKLGSGAFGIVYHATWRKAPCAVKQLLVDGKNEKAHKEFLKEAINMKKIRPHPNVVGMLGVAVNPEFPLCIVTEFLPQGSLDNLLSNSSVSINSGQALAMSADVASGMSHLHKESIIHCDLAARNLLCSKSNDRIIVKVADFGLSKISDSGIYDASSDHKFPVKWSSPEVLLHGKFSKASDVWSYGVVLYEIFERRLPYAGMSNKEVIEEVCDKEYRLKKPSVIQIPDELYLLMREMWNSTPEKRPNFEVIYDRIKEIQQKYGYNDPQPVLAPTGSKDDENYAEGKKALGFHEDNYNAMSFKGDDGTYNEGKSLGLRD